MPEPFALVTLALAHEKLGQRDTAVAYAKRAVDITLNDGRRAAHVKAAIADLLARH